MLRALTRRGVVFALALAFFPLGLLAAISLRVEVTFLNPNFLVEHLDRAGLAEPLRDHVSRQKLTHGADRAIGRDPHADPTPLAARSPLERALIEEGVEVSGAIFTEAWILEQTRLVLGDLLPFLARLERHFSVRFMLAHRVSLATGVFAKHLPRSEAVALAYDRSIEALIEEVLEQHPQLPLGLEPTPETLRELFKGLLPKTWVISRLVQTIEQLVEYLTGKRDDFALLLPLQERMDRFESLERFLLGANIRRFLLEFVVRPAVHQGLGETLTLPWQLTLSEDEIIKGFDKVLAPEWVEAHKKTLISNLVRYLNGEQDRFEVRISLRERRSAAVRVLAELIINRLRATLTALPRCPNIETYQRQLADHSHPLRCGFDGIEAIATMIMLDLKLSERLSTSLEEHLPDEWVYTEAKMRERLGPNTWQWIQRVRRMLHDGWVLTEADLREKLGEEHSAQLESLRSTIRQGVPWDDHALYALALRVDEKNPERIEALRSRLSSAWLLTRLCLPLATVALLTVLLFGASGVWPRVRLAAVLLATLGLLLLVGAWFMISTLDDAAEIVKGLLPQTDFNNDFAKMLSEMASDFLTGLRWQAGILLVSGTALVVILGKLRRAPKTRTEPESPPPLAEVDDDAPST